MKNKLFALLMAAAMIAAMAPAALAEGAQTDAAEETVVAEPVVTTAEEVAVEKATPDTAKETKAAEVIEEETVDAAAEEATGKVPESVIIGDEDIQLETADIPTSLTLDYTTITIKVGEKFDVVAHATPNTYENRHAALLYSTSDARYFTVAGDANNTCTITGVKETATGEVLTVTSQANPKVTTTCRIIVSNSGSNNPITEVHLDKTSASMSVNQKLTLTASFLPANTTSSKALYWGSDNKNVASVEGGANETGIITAKSSGTAHIYVETTNGKYAYCTITVAGIKLNDTHMNLTHGASQQLIATVDGANKSVSWSSSDSAVASVNANGLVTAGAAGNATITAKSADGLTATCTVSVFADKAKVTQFVIRLYDVCLNRSPDAGGLISWVEQLENGTKSGSEVASGFVFSNEFMHKNYCNTCYVKQLYRAFMGREADTNGMNYWLEQLNAGATRENVFNGFALSKEFQRICDDDGIKLGNGVKDPGYGKGTMPTGPCSACGYDGVTPFVTRLYETCMLRNPEPIGMEYWYSNLYNHSKTGRDVAAGFIFSNEFKNAHYNDKQYVERLYRAFMNRDADAIGMEYWLGKLNAGESREQIFDGFVGSNEFNNICGKYGILRG